MIYMTIANYMYFYECSYVHTQVYRFFSDNFLTPLNLSNLSD